MHAQVRKSNLRLILAERLNAASSPPSTPSLNIEGRTAAENANDQRLKQLESKLEFTCERITREVKSFDQTFTSLGQDAQKLNYVVDTLVERLAAAEHGLRELHTGFARVMDAVHHLEPDPMNSETEAEREATAKVLSSLTKLVEDMRARP